MIDTFEPQQPLLDRITINPRVMVGKPTIRGLRITEDQVLRALAAGVTHQELLDDYLNLEADDIYAVLLYAASRAKTFGLA